VRLVNTHEDLEWIVNIGVIFKSSTKLLSLSFEIVSLMFFLFSFCSRYVSSLCELQYLICNFQIYSDKKIMLIIDDFDMFFPPER
jgi:hypothetical protein